MQKKKEYLKQYIFQETKIKSFEEFKNIHTEKTDEYNRKIAECKKLREEIEYKISVIDDPVLSELLMQKYVFGKTIDELAISLNYSRRHILRLQIKALEKFVF